MAMNDGHKNDSRGIFSFPYSIFATNFQCRPWKEIAKTLIAHSFLSLAALGRVRRKIVLEVDPRTRTPMQKHAVAAAN